MLLQLKEISVVERKPIRQYDSVLCFGDSDWWYHNRGHADMQFMRRFARQTRVVYVNSLGVKTPSVGEGRMFIRKVARKLKSVSRFYRNGGEGFNVVSPIFFPFSKGLTAAVARSALTLQLRNLLRALHMDRPLIWVACPTAALVLDTLPSEGVVYQLSDCYGALNNGKNSSVIAFERALVERADLVVCSSEKLLERAQRLYGKGEYIDHGVDFDLFERAGLSKELPPELKNIRNPIIGFYGNIDGNTVDRHLLEAVIRQRPQYTFVLVGDMASEFEILKRLPNVVSIPRQAYQKVAQYGGAFNVCLMPWRQNEWIEHCNPVKLKEYLALGKPVVSTPFPELRRCGSLCLEARGPADFAAAIDKALADDSPGKQAERRAWASHHTWDEKFNFVMALLRERGIQADGTA